ncbi:MAG: hypothetical protein HYZ75_18055 [Elusimicrobia bacterium]|nr:hypothetical protein [Elusimicrobiota bacterium]
MTSALLLAFSLAAPASAARTPVLVAVGTATRTGYEEFSVLGWGDACSVAVRYMRFPPEGAGLRGVPDAFRAGLMSLPPDGDAQVEDWIYSSDKGTGYASENMSRVVEDLRGERRHDRPGTAERLRSAHVADQPGLETLLNSTTVFKSDPPLGGFPERFRFAAVHYAPLGSCALFEFVDPATPRDGLRTKLVRLPEPGVRRARARAHVTNALLLYRNETDLTAAEAELAVASAMDPQYPLARYNHAILLTLHGRFNAAIESLKAAVKHDGAWAEEASRASEFEPLREDPRFKAVLAGAPPPRRRPEPKRPPAASTDAEGEKLAVPRPIRRHY